MQIGSTLLPGCGLAAASMAAEHWQPGSDWETYNKSLEGQRYSPLSEINASNAANLTEVCRAPRAARGSLESARRAASS